MYFYEFYTLIAAPFPGDREHLGITSSFVHQTSWFTLLAIGFDILHILYICLMKKRLIFSVIAFALFLVLLIEQLQNKQLFKLQSILGYLIFGLGLLSILIQIQTTNSTWLLDPIEKMPFGERLIKGFISFFKGLITIPDFRTIRFWNTNLLVNLSKPICSVFALLIYFVPMLLFFKNKKTLYQIYFNIYNISSYKVFYFV